MAFLTSEFTTDTETQNEFKAGTKVLSSNKKEVGVLTGSKHHCTMEGCLGLRLTTKWTSGKKTSFTHPCTKGMTFNNNQWEIG